MIRKEKTSMRKMFLGFLALYCLVLSGASKVASAQVGNSSTFYCSAFTLRRRLISAQPSHWEILDELIITYNFRLIVVAKPQLMATYGLTYALEKIRKQIIDKRTALQHRQYLAYTPRENRKFVAKELFRYAHDNAFDAFKNGRSREAKASCIIAKFICLQNEKSFGRAYKELLQRLTKLMHYDFDRMSKKEQ